MELRHLRYFVAVAEELSFSRAAERLRMAQPPLSQQIRNLEKEMGNTQLFDRASRPIRLTLAGESFLAEAYLILAQIDQAVQTAKQIGSGEQGRLVIGFTSSIANSILPTIVQSFQTRYPKVELIWQELSAKPQVQQLRNHQIDVGLSHFSDEVMAYEDLSYRVVITEPMMVVLPENHSLANRRKIKLEMLKDEKFVLPTKAYASGLTEQIYLAFYKVNIVPQVAQEATLMLTVLGLVAGGVGISLLPENVQNLQRRGVVYKALVGDVPTVKMAAVWRKDNVSPVLSSFLETVAKLM